MHKTVLWNNYTKLLLAAILWFFIMGLAYVLLRNMLLDHLAYEQRIARGLILTVAEFLANLGVLVFLFISLEQRLKSTLFEMLNFKNKNYLLLAFLMPIVLFIAVFYLALDLSPIEQSKNPSILHYFWEGGSFIPRALYFFIAFKLFIVAPIFQEFIFRFYMIETFKMRMGVIVACILASILYAIFRTMLLNLFEALPTILIGLLFCWFYIKSKSIFPPLIMNAMTTSTLYAFVLSSN